MGGQDARSQQRQPRFLAAGDTAFVVEFGEAVDPAINRQVMDLARAIRQTAPAGVVDLVPTFRSLMVHYDPTTVRRTALEQQVHDLIGSEVEGASAGRLWRMPTLYGGAYGPDLEEVASQTGLAVDAVVECHASVEYEVYMMGFLPGLPYLGILPEALALPRRSEPRVRVPAGSVAIATNLANIYPSESPGGWHILGRTPIELFDLRRPVPILLDAGDRIRFEPIDEDTFTRLHARAETGDPVIEPETEAAS